MIRTISIFLLVVTIVTSCSTRYDIVITNGSIYDGSGSESYLGDIGIKDGRIIEIGEIPPNAKTVIDAEGLIVSPGFIDVHTHCDNIINHPERSASLNYLKQGVTTVVSGNCGSGTYNVERYFNKLDSIGIGINIAHLVGHNSIRGKVMGMDDREPTQTELDEMKALVNKAMEEGAAGMSTGLFYTPANYSTTEEVIELCKELKNHNRIFASHIRDESNYNIGLEESVKEAIHIGEKSGVPVQISHLKALGKPVWGSSERICAIIEEARKNGIKIYADQYPYIASSTSLTAAVIPDWVRADGKLIERLSNHKLISGIKKEIANNIDRRGGAEAFLILPSAANKMVNAKYLSEICKETGFSPVETAISLVKKGNSNIISFNMNETDLKTFMQKSFVMTSSDGHVVKPDGSFTHPRSYGSFPHKIRKYVLEGHLISMEQAIRSATTLPAEMFQLKHRGELKTGYIADITIFDPEKFTDKSTFTAPHHYSEGVEYLIINGQLIIDNSKYNGKLEGKTIRF